MIVKSPLQQLIESDEFKMACAIAAHEIVKLSEAMNKAIAQIPVSDEVRAYITELAAKE